MHIAEACALFSQVWAAKTMSTSSAIPGLHRCPCVLLAFLVFLSNRRGGGFVKVEVEVANASQKHRQQIQFGVDRDSTIEDNLTKCSALLGETHRTAVPESHLPHATLCICMSAGMPVSQTSYVASVTEFDQAVQFSSPDTQDPQTKNAVLQHIYQQLVT